MDKISVLQLCQGYFHFQLVEYIIKIIIFLCGKGKRIPRQAEVALGVPGRLRPRLFSTFGTTRVVGRQPNAPAAFTPGEIPGIHFQRLSRPQDTSFCRKEPRKKIPSGTSGDRSRDRLTSSAAHFYVDRSLLFAMAIRPWWWSWWRRSWKSGRKNEDRRIYNIPRCKSQKWL